MTIKLREALRMVAEQISERDQRPFAECIDDAFDWLVERGFVKDQQLINTVYAKRRKPV